MATVAAHTRYNPSFGMSGPGHRPRTSGGQPGDGSCVEEHLAKKGYLMRLLRRLGPLAGLLFLLGLWLPAISQAQSALNSATNLALLNSLSPAQQQAVMSRLNGSSSTGLLPQNQTNASQLQQLEQQQAVEAERRKLKEKPLIPELQGGDWVIVQIGVKLPPREPEPGEQGAGMISQAAQLSALQGGTGTGSRPLVLADIPASTSGFSQAELQQIPSQLTALSTAERDRINTLMQSIRAHDPYRLSADGMLDLPGLAPISLLGLTQTDATLRLSVVPAFQYLQVRVTLLPLKRTGEEALKPFGYDVFAQQASIYTAVNPLSNVPVPSDYRVGPGDVIDVQLYGNQNEAYQLTVGRDGRIDFPQLGPISVGGQLFSAVQGELQSRVAHQMIGVHASVTMAETRSIQVFVLGDAFRPGVYTLSGIDSITSALYAAGGIAKTGSLRRVELIRNGVVIDTLDLYDLLIHGSTANDATLLQGDVVFVPPVGSTVAIDGEVQRPAIYEMKGESNPAQAIALAGGLKPDADIPDATVTRILPDGERVVRPLELGANGAVEGLRNGDYIHVPRLKPALDQSVAVQGNVYNPGIYAYQPGMRLTDVLRSVAELKPNSDLHYILIRRELPPDLHVVAVSADLAAALAQPDSAANIRLLPHDEITVFDLSSSRQHIIQPILTALKDESSAAQPEQAVRVEGQVNVPGQYPLEPGMRVADLIRAGGGLSNSAFTGRAELTRYVIDANGTRHTEIFNIDLAEALQGNPAANLQLSPFDVLTVEQVSQWSNHATVTLVGEVRFPGTYTFRPGETLKSVIERAGGLTQWAFPQGAVFTRVELRQREQQEMDRMAQRMKVELSVLALRASATATGGSAAAGANSMIVAKSLLQQLQSEQAVGRLVINLPEIVKQPAGSADDVILRNGDTLVVPKYEQEVTVIGEVQNPTAHLYSPDLSRNAYIQLSGGFTAQADRKRIYVVRANGSVVAGNGGSFWFSHSGTKIEPGDTIVVPINAEQMLPLPFWQAVTSILYNIAIAAAAVHAL